MFPSGLCFAESLLSVSHASLDGADETTKAASAAASQVAVEASKVDWAGLAEGALEQTVVFLVYVPVFAYTFAASLPAEEQFVLGLVALLVVGSFAKQDD